MSLKATIFYNRPFGNPTYEYWRPNGSHSPTTRYRVACWMKGPPYKVCPHNHKEYGNQTFL